MKQDDIIFENRNKAYGAYFLRKGYNNFLSKSLIITITSFIIIVLIPFFVFKEARSITTENMVMAEMIELSKPPENIELPKPPELPKELEQRLRFTAPVITSDTVENTDILNQDELNTRNTNNIITNEIDTTSVMKPNNIIEQKPPALMIVSVMPTFVGGDVAMYKYLGSDIKYPKIAKETGIEGTVVVTFVIETDGSITDVKLLKDIGGGCGEEAIRLVNGMPKWNPGRQNNTPARVQFNLPIKFTLEK
jgi:protein TonB